jgi:hypothetical protein
MYKTRLFTGFPLLQSGPCRRETDFESLLNKGFQIFDASAGVEYHNGLALAHKALSDQFS